MSEHDRVMTYERSRRRQNAPLRGRARSGYTLAMKAAISVPDDVLQQIDRLARRLQKSRSALCRQAVAQYLRHARAAMTEALDGLARASVVVPPP